MNGLAFIVWFVIAPIGTIACVGIGIGLLVRHQRFVATAIHTRGEIIDFRSSGNSPGQRPVIEFLDESRKPHRLIPDGPPMSSLLEVGDRVDVYYSQNAPDEDISDCLLGVRQIVWPLFAGSPFFCIGAVMLTLFTGRQVTIAAIAGMGVALVLFFGMIFSWRILFLRHQKSIKARARD